MKFVFFADLHLNNIVTGKLDPETLLPIRVLDIKANLDLVVETAIEQDVELVLFGGDAYKTYAPPQEYKVIFHEAIKTLADNGIKVVLIPGNHDMTKRGSAKHALTEFRSLQIENVWVTGREPEVFDFGDYEVVAIGWQTDYVDYWLPEPNPDKISICIAHCTLDMANFYGGITGETLLGADFVLSQNYLEQFDWVGLGHIHKPQVISQSPFIGYPGSSEILDWGELGEPHGFYYYDGQRTNHIKYKTRPRYKLEGSEKEILSQLNVDPEGMYKLKIYCDQGYQPSQKLLKLLNKSFEYKIEKIYPNTTRERLKGLPNLSNLTETEQLELYFEQTDQDFNEVRDLWTEILGS